MTFFEKLRLGFKSFSKAHQFIKQHRLWHFVYIPGVVNAIFFLLFINWVTSSITEWVDGIFSFDCDDSFLGWFCSIFSFVTNFLEYFIRLMLYTALIGVYLFIYKSIIYSKQNKSLASSIGSVFQLVFFIPAIGWMLAPTYSAIAAYFAVDELDKGKY